MTDAGRSTGEVYWYSVFIGAYVGISAQMVVALLVEPVDSAEIWTIPVLLLVYGMFAVPFVALGLALFGLPLTRLLHRSAQRWWVGLIAAVCGSVAGKIMFYAVDHLLFFGVYDIMEATILDMGVLYGLPTGLAWWALYRREVASH
jgi:hypothetical protein